MRSSPNWALNPFKSPTACQRRIWARSSASGSKICAPKRRFERSWPLASRAAQSAANVSHNEQPSRASEKLDSRWFQFVLLPELLRASCLVDRLGVAQISAVENSVGDRTNGEKIANRHGPR